MFDNIDEKDDKIKVFDNNDENNDKIASLGTAPLAQFVTVLTSLQLSKHKHFSSLV